MDRENYGDDGDGDGDNDGKMMHLVGLISETMRSISVTEETRTKS